MNAEEFHGHLMAALHGPHSQEIAARVVKVIVDSPVSDDDAEKIGAWVGAMAQAALGDILEEVMELLMLTHLQSLGAAHGVDTPAKHVAVAQAKAAIIKTCRARLCARLLACDPETAKSLAAKLFLTLPKPKAGGDA